MVAGRHCLTVSTLVFFYITHVVAVTQTTLPLTVLDDRVFRTSFALSNPVQNIYAVVDLSSAHILLHPSVVLESRTYVPVGDYDGYEYVQFGHALPVYMPVRIVRHVADLARMNVANALAVLGMGVGSPVWQHWRCGSFSMSEVTLSHDACVVTHYSNEQLFHCASARTSYSSHALCTVDEAYSELLPPHDVQLGRIFFFAHSAHESAIPLRLWQNLRQNYGPLQTESYAHWLPRVCFGDRVCADDHCFPLCLWPDVYVSTQYARYRLAITSSKSNDSVISTDALFSYQFHYDHEAQTLRVVEARTHSHTPHFHVALVFLWTLLLLVWRSLNTHYTDTLCKAEKEYRLTRAPVIFVEIALLSSVLVFLIYFTTRSGVWDLPLPDGSWILYFYVTLTGYCAAAGFVDFYCLLMPGNYNSKTYVWLGRPLLVETQILLVLWLVQLHTLPGVWHTKMSVFFFGIFYLHWTQRMFTLLVARWNPYLPPVVRIRARKVNRLLIFLVVLFPVHSYVFMHRLLLPLVLTSPLGNSGYVHALVITSPICMHILFIMTTKTRVVLCKTALLLKE